MPPQLVGIAKLAANGPVLETKRTVEYRELPTQKLINRCDNKEMPFQWTINPYRGCEYGCKYCYARYTHGFMELRGTYDFENLIYAKRIASPAFRSELARIPLGEGIAMGTATDPYQPAERRYFLSRRILQVFAETSGLRLYITTKSDLVARDCDLFQEIQHRHWLYVSVTVTTLDTELARIVEPRAPRPDLRLAAVTKLAEAGVRVGVQCCPILPLLTDRELPALARAAADAGAHYFHGHAVFLRGEARDIFLMFLQERFPHLAAKYRNRFEREAYLPADYTKRLAERVREARVAAGLPEHRPDDNWKPVTPQMAFAF